MFNRFSNTQSKLAASFKLNTTEKSPNLIKFLITLFVIIIPMIIIFLLLGEPNLLGQNNLVAQNGRWYGEGIINKITFPRELGFYKWININDQIANATGDHKKALEAFAQEFYQTHNYHFGTGVITNFLIWVVMLADFIFGLILSIILIFSVKKVRWDILVPLVSSWFGFFIMIISGLIHAHFWGYLIRFVLVLVAFILPIIIMVRITNALIARSKHAAEYTADLYNEYQNADTYYKAGQERILLMRKQDPNKKSKFKIEKKDESNETDTKPLDSSTNTKE
ncbi:hypothetical protein OF376_00625 [Ureaplasma miroungigenitalium]|uniref:ABC transporter permease n=1 Tax=Ureaplasma miroungigenitalium TaxID=1042321 RepID=A0ABT3BMN8_9BACT|nr:hypothetical protein [Ureaplasma miroungigenitalium]MCV3728292.1 hypothetical protein [Ureaplasma miroungigenitalium]MCV3734097.1 hypothetical protein [Ureaplasma miroungigenitalium]